MKTDTYILNLETSTKNCSVAISKNGVMIALKEVNEGNYAHAELLNPFIEAVLIESKISFPHLSAVAISKGPGSYTGLRIGVSTAKGICFALNIPLISLETLLILAHQIENPNGIIIPMLDARRMEVYMALFDAEFKKIKPTQAVIVEEGAFEELLKDQKVYFVGDGVEKCKHIMQHQNAILDTNTFPSAREMCKLSFNKFLMEDFEDVAYFEPYYLKDFIALKKQ